VRKIRDGIGWALLGASFLIGCTTVYWGSAADEGDNLAVGLLLRRGYVLYDDIFSHHFPFTYYWALALLCLFGKSILAARLSVWLFQVFSFAIASKLSHLHLSLGLSCLLWSLLRHLYRSNMLLYPPFSGAALAAIFAIVLSVSLGLVDASWKHSLFVGLLSVISILCDPLSIYAILIATIYLMATDRRKGSMALLVMAAGLLIYAGFLYVSGTWQGFLAEAISFNAQVYSKYIYAGPLKFREIVTMAAKGLEIADSTWLDFDAFRSIPQGYRLDSWLFTGFLYRLALLLSTVLLLAQKKFAAASLLYLFACATLVIARWDFRAAGFVMISLLAVSGIVTREWWKERAQARTRLPAAIAIGVGLMAAWLVVRVVTHTYISNRAMLAYEANFGGYEAEAAQLMEAACGQPDVFLAHYPGGTYFYWFTEMQPPSGYLFMWPWVAEIGLSDVLEILKQEQVLALVRLEDTEIWGLYQTRDFLHPLYEYVDTHYLRMTENLYTSPYLAAKCQQSR
jgi:hypothetical protein